jgi:putative nucleotidyltransferase with HDIG domain
MPINEDEAPCTLTLVDDEPLMRATLAMTARSWQYTCQEAASAEQALQLMEKCPTPVVVTDLRMSGLDGIWLMREVQRRWPQTGIIVVSGADDSAAARACLNSGAQRYLLKPINYDEFHHAIQTTLHTVHLERERERYRQELEQKVHRQTRQVRRTFLSAIDSLVRTLEAKHPNTKGHSIRVKQYALHLAQTLKLDERQRDQLKLAAKLHDIGKVGTPESILNKDGLLTPSELRIIREHPLVGEQILKPIIWDPVILAAIRGHHERLDGKGYPDGLKGAQLPLLARIIAIADCFDALTSSRAYRRAMKPAHALDILRRGAGTQFDPIFVQAFCRLELASASGEHAILESVH